MPVLLLFKHPISKELGRAKAFFHVFVRAVFNGHPCEHHNAIGDGTQLRVHGIRPVRVLELSDADDDIVDWLQQLLEDGKLWLCGFRGEKQELPLFLEPAMHLAGLWTECVGQLAGEVAQTEDI